MAAPATCCYTNAIAIRPGAARVTAGCGGLTTTGTHRPPAASSAPAACPPAAVATAAAAGPPAARPSVADDADAAAHPPAARPPVAATQLPEPWDEQPLSHASSPRLSPDASPRATSSRPTHTEAMAAAAQSPAASVVDLSFYQLASPPPSPEDPAINAARLARQTRHPRMREHLSDGWRRRDSAASSVGSLTSLSLIRNGSRDIRAA